MRAMTLVRVDERRLTVKRFFVVVMLLGVLGAVDYVAGYEISFSIFYLAPVALATVTIGFSAGMLSAIVGASIWLLADLAQNHIYSHAVIPYWNAAVRLGLFMLFTVLLDRIVVAARYLEGANAELDSRVQQRTAELQQANEKLLNEIAERMLAEAEARQHEARYRDLFERMTNGFALHEIICDANGIPCDYRFLEVNPCFEAMTGLKRESIVGKTARELIPDVEDFWIDRYGQVALTGVSAHFEDYSQPLGKHFEVIAYSPAKGLFAVMINDITARKGAECEVQEREAALKRMIEALRVSEAEYRSLVDGAPYGIYRSSPEGRLLAVNPALVQMLGCSSAEECRTLNLGNDVYSDPADRRALLEKLVGADQVEGFETDWKRRDGAIFRVRLAVRAVRDPQGALAYFEVIVEDITERHVLEEQFRQALKMEAVGRLAGGVAHDFNNLLAVIIGYADLLGERLTSQHPGKRDLEQISQAASRAANLTRQLLAFGRKQVRELKVIDLGELIDEFQKMLTRLISEDIQLVARRAPGLGRVKVDPGQIEQIVMNLAVNARDAMPEGGNLTIETSNVEVDEQYARLHRGMLPGRFVLLAVSDTGHGMDEGTMAHVFEPFFTTKGKGKGTGLGLSVVYGIVKQSGGFVWVYSEPGIGTTFKIYLPRVDEELTGITSRPALVTASGSEAIVVVEDESALRSLIAETLANRGYRVFEAGDATNALRVIKEHADEIDLIVTDVVMPGMSGRELARQALAIRPSVKVLYISGYTENAIAHHGVLDPDVAFLPKPFRPGDLARKVREVLDDSGHRETGRS